MTDIQTYREENAQESIKQSTEENIIQLGDIVKVVAKADHKLHDSSFYVSYVDPQESIELIHIGTMQPHVLIIVKGRLVDDEIKQIHVVNRSIHKGYCRQNGLFPNTWVTIDFGGEIPSIVTAQITHLEEDMITLMTYPEQETLYLDFEYKGIPKHIPIMKICIRDKPSSYEASKEESVEDLLEEVDNESSMSYTDNGDIVVKIPTNAAVDENIHDQLSHLYNESRIADSDEQSPEESGSPEYLVDRPSQFMRYKLETQINHLLDDLLASVSDVNRTDRVLHRIYTHIQRFQELRDQFSTRDEYGQIVSAIYKNPMTHKPLSQILMQMNRVVPYIRVVSSQYKKLYDVAQSGGIDYDHKVMDTIDDLEDENQRHNDIARVNYANREDRKYVELQTNQASFGTPFLKGWTAASTMVPNLPVHMDYETILSNDNRFSSSAVTAKTKIIESHDTLFATARYLTTEYYPEYNPRKRETAPGILIPSETLDVNGLLFMPRDLVEYTRVYLPGSSILTKANLHQTPWFPSRWFVSQDPSKVDREEVFIERNYKPDQAYLPLSKKMRFLEIDPSQEELEDKTPQEKYNALLQQVIPNIFTVLVEYLKNNSHLYNWSDILRAFEPFYIESPDISFKAAEIIKNKLRINIQNYINNYQVLLKEYNKLRLQTFNAPNTRLSEIYNRLSMNLFSRNFDYQHMVFAHYKLDVQRHNNQELLYQILLRDNGALFEKVVQVTNLDLFSPTELLPSDFDEDEEFEPVNKNLCMRKNLAKRYSSIKELQDDNDFRELEYDAEFDDTNYDLMKQYKNEKEAMENDVFVDFLSEQLILKHKCPRSLSESMARTLIRGKKLVGNGDYAILELRPQVVGDESSLSDKEKEKVAIEQEARRKINYYRRQNHVWIYDKDIDDNAFIDTNTLLCNIKESCYKNKDTCENVDGETNPRLRKQTKQEILAEFSERYTEEMETKKARLEAEIEKLTQNLETRMDSEAFQMSLFDRKAFEMGQTAVFIETNLSPYQYVHDLILQPSFDFYKKQQYLIKMVHDYCREPLPSESPHWKYCLQTNAPLVENSLYKLAIAFQNGEYNKVLQHLCRTLGREDENQIYDRETGCILKNIEYQEDAALDYNRGRDIDEDDLEAAFEELDIDDKVVMEIDSAVQQKKVYNFDQDTQYFYQLLQSLCKKGEGMDIEIESIQETVLQLCSALLNEKRIFMGEKVYLKEQDKNKNKVRKAPPMSYKKYVSTKKLEVLVSSFIVAVQCLIPSIRRRKTFPGCVQSFRGYPLEEGMDDLSSLTYVACVLRKKSKESDSAPWNTVSKKENVMEERIQKMLDKFVVPHPYAKNLLERKRIYDRENADTYVIPEDLDVAKTWSRFTPIIVPFSVHSEKAPIRNVTEGFIGELMAALKQGKKAQWDHIGVLNQKIDLLSAAVIEAIRNHVRKQDALLMTQSKIPFLQNACCSDGLDTPLQYFASEDESILKYVNQCIQNAMALRDVGLLSKAYFLNEKKTAKNASSTILDVKRNKTLHNAYHSYDDHIQYQAFIYYCNLDNPVMPIADDLKVVCGEKLEQYDHKASLEEKIELLKNNGHRLSQTKFVEMMKIIHRRNCIVTHSYDINARAEVNRQVKLLIELFDTYPKIPESFANFVNVFWKLFDDVAEDQAKLAESETEEEYKQVETGFCAEEDEEDGDKKGKQSGGESGGAGNGKYDAFINFVTPEITRLKTSLHSFLREQNPRGFSVVRLKTIFEKLFPTQEPTNYIQYCHFMKNYLYSLCVEYPLHFEDHFDSHQQIHFPSHWPTTAYDALELHKYIQELRETVVSKTQDRHLVPLMKALQTVLRPISEILKFFYNYFPNQHHKLYIRLFQYLCLIVFQIHIDLATDETIANQTFHAVNHRNQNDDGMDDNAIVDVVEVTNLVPVEDTSAAIQLALGQLFQAYFDKVLTRKYEYPTLSYAEIMKRVEQSAEEEKASVKTHFQNMSKEERRAEMLMKSLHLGIFNVNNKKLISYGNDEQANLFGAVMNEKEMDDLEDRVMERLLDPDAELHPMVEMPDENDPDAEAFVEEPDEDMFDIAENAFEQNLDN